MSGRTTAGLHQIEERYRVIEVHSRLETKPGVCRQLYPLPRSRRRAPRKSFPKRVFDHGGQGPMRLSSEALSVSKQVVVQSNCGPHASNHI